MTAQERISLLFDKGSVKEFATGIKPTDPLDFKGPKDYKKILPVLKDSLFLNAFRAKGRFRNMMENISVKVILNERAALLGAARYAIGMLRS